MTTDNPFKVLLNCFHVYDYEENEDKYDFHMFWGALKPEKYNKLKPNQRISTFPGCWQLGRKDYLSKNLMKQKRKFPSDYYFVP